MNCPHCGKLIPDNHAMCADCADTIATNQLFEMFTFGGSLSDDRIGKIVNIVFGALYIIIVVTVLAWVILSGG